MKKTLGLLMFAAMIMITGASCNSNKIACPTYAESFPESTKKSKKPEAPKALPKKSKAVVSHSMKPG